MHNVIKVNVVRVVGLLRVHRTLSGSRFRSLSSGTASEPAQTVPPLPGNEVSLFGPKDHRVPLPGNVGIPASEFRSGFTYQTPLFKHSRHLTELDLYKIDVSEDRQRRVYTRLLEATFDSCDPCAEGILLSDPAVDCKVQECPLLIRRDFQELFPDHDILTQPLTVITVVHRAVFGNVLHSDYMEQERERLTESFVSKAQKAVRQLYEAGYWAEFINPHSRKSYLTGRFGDALSFETDERYRHSGFTIEDIGCCKLVTHHEWGRSAFIGCIFTNAPVSSIDVQQIVSGHQN